MPEVSPRISIVIPSFNQGNFLEKAIQSVLSQEYPSVEIIVVDGGSTDSSLDVVHRYASQLSWWVSEPDRGQSEAINKGFARCNGDVITFLSSDDYYLPAAFANVAETFRHHPKAGAVVGAFSILDEGQIHPNTPVQPYLQPPSPADLSLGPPGIYRLHQVSTFYSRDALDLVGRYVREDMKYVMDRELLYRICRSFPIVLSDHAYGVFRHHPDSKSVSDILPFAREFSRLYLLQLSGDASADKKRRRMARHRMARGWVKYSVAVKKFPHSFLALFRAGLLEPSSLFSPSYWSKFVRPHRNHAD